jgi:hypothetical protein
MPGHPVAELAALDALRSQRRIFSGDSRCRRRVRFPGSALFPPFLRLGLRRCARRADPLWRAHRRGRGCRDLRPDADQQTEFDRLADGLDALATHFRAEGLL